MAKRKKILLSWSSGKDSAWMVHELRRQGEYDIAGILTTLNETFDRVAMHAVRRQLLEAQAKALGLPLRAVPIPWPCSNGEYEERMNRAVATAREGGIEGMAFGDLFLEDVRRYRVEKLAGTGLEPLFPLWGRDTARLAREMIEGGLEAVITCVDPKQLDPRFAGRLFDEMLLTELPPGVDPCGERGEFHSFCFAGPMYDEPIPYQTGERIEREGFVFVDLAGETVAAPEPRRR